MGFEFKNIKVSQKENVWTLEINRPESLNALNLEVINEMGEFLRGLGEMSFDNARALILTGAGEKAFVAGADIREMSNLTAEEATQFAQRGQSVLTELSFLKIPVVAAVNGFALGGGCELALACDFIVASQNAKFGLPEVSLGLIPGFGGTVRLSRAVGIRRARELIFSGDMISAEEAYRIGLVNQVVPQEELLLMVQKTISKILSRAPLAVAAAKKSINRSWDMEIDEAQQMEAEYFSELFTCDDTREGMKAFIEKRKADFKGQ